MSEFWLLSEGDGRYVAGVQREQKSQKLLTILQETIKLLLKEGVESGEPISYQNPLAQRLCTVLELILSFGLKEKLGELTTFWKLVDHPKVISDLGFTDADLELLDGVKCRIWIRRALNKGVFAAQIQSLIQNHSLVSQFYDDYASVRHADLRGICVQLLFSLEALRFALSLYNVDAPPDETELLEPNKKKVTRAPSTKRRKKGAKIAIIETEDTEQSPSSAVSSGATISSPDVDASSGTVVATDEQREASLSTASTTTVQEDVDAKSLTLSVSELREREQRLSSLQNTMEERLRDIASREKQFEERTLKLKQLEDELKLKEVHIIQHELLFNDLKKQLDVQQHTLDLEMTRLKQREEDLKRREDAILQQRNVTHTQTEKERSSDEKSLAPASVDDQSAPHTDVASTLAQNTKANEQIPSHGAPEETISRLRDELAAMKIQCEAMKKAAAEEVEAKWHDETNTLRSLNTALKERLREAQDKCCELQQQREQLENDMKRLQSDFERQRLQETQQVQELNDKLLQQKQQNEALRTALLEKEQRLASALNILEAKLKQEETYKADVQSLQETIRARDEQIAVLTAQVAATSKEATERVSVLQQRLSALEAEIRILKQQQEEKHVESLSSGVVRASYAHHVASPASAAPVAVNTPAKSNDVVDGSHQNPAHTNISKTANADVTFNAVNVDKIATNKVVLYSDYPPSSSATLIPTEHFTAVDDVMRLSNVQRPARVSDNANNANRTPQRIVRGIETSIPVNETSASDVPAVGTLREIHRDKSERTNERHDDNSVSEPRNVTSTGAVRRLPLVAPPPGWQWTPPKKQIFYFLHETPHAFSRVPSAATSESASPHGTNPKILLLAQQYYLCFGCGKSLLVGNGIIKNVRYCDYSGKYFCSQCHKMDKFIIPARIVFNWDFDLYPVSVFYKTFLKEIFKEPLFDVKVLNPQLFTAVPQFKSIRGMRKQLFYMKDYITSCKMKEKAQLIPEDLQNRWHLVDSPFYSLQDFVDIKNDRLGDFLNQIRDVWITHIANCQICKAKGTFCEFCHSDEIIYSFQLRKTIVCKTCKALAHRKCYKKETCPKCLSLHQRQEKPNASSQEGPIKQQQQQQILLLAPSSLSPQQTKERK
jgi:hypothetical protein